MLNFRQQEDFRLPRRILALAFSGLLVSCGSEPTVEQQIIGVIGTMEAQVEAAERGAFIGQVAPDFRGQDGAMSRDQLNALVLLQLNQHRRVQAQLGPITVSSNLPEEATASFHMLLTGGAGWLPESGQVFQVTTHWAVRDGDWRLVAAEWKPVDLASMGQ